MKGRGPVLIAGEGEPLRGHQLLDHGHDAGGGRVVQDADCVLEQIFLCQVKIRNYYHEIW